MSTSSAPVCLIELPLAIPTAFRETQSGLHILTLSLPNNATLDVSSKTFDLSLVPQFEKLAIRMDVTPGRYGQNSYLTVNNLEYAPHAVAAKSGKPPAASS